MVASAARTAAARPAACGAGTTWYDAVVLLRHLRLVSLLRKGALTLASLEYLVMDEADKLLELGFLEQCDEVLAACDGVALPLLGDDAAWVEDLVHSVLRQPVKVLVGEKNAAADTVEQSLIVCGREDGKLVALRQMVREGLRPPVLIFVQSVERLMQLFHLLHPRLAATSNKPTAFTTAAKHAASAASGVVVAAVAAPPSPPPSPPLPSSCLHRRPRLCHPHRHPLHRHRRHRHRRRLPRISVQTYSGALGYAGVRVTEYGVFKDVQWLTLNVHTYAPKRDKHVQNTHFLPPQAAKKVPEPRAARALWKSPSC